MTSVYPNIHDRARALSHSTGISLTAAYSELAKRSGAARNARRKRNLGSMEVTVADLSAVSGIEASRQWLPYADL